MMYRIESQEGYAGGGVIQRFGFLDIVILENKSAFQECTKYLFQVTRQSVGTIRIQYTYVREFLRYLEENLHSPHDLRVMSVILIHTGVVKGKLFLLKGTDINWYN